MRLMSNVVIGVSFALFSNASFAHEFSDREKHFRATSMTTVKDYVRYLSGEDLNNFENLSCLHIKLDYIDLMNRALDEEGVFGGVSYYYQDDLIYFNRMFASFTEAEFKKEVSSVRKLLLESNRPRGKIPEESLYLAALSRLFSEYWIGIGKFTEEIDLRNKRKCKDYKFEDHN